MKKTRLIWIYTLIVFIFMCVALLTKGEIKTFFFGIGLGVIIGQLIYFIGGTYEES